MYVIESSDAQAFEFEFEGTAYSVPQLAALPMDDLMEFAEAAELGETASLKWMLRFFKDATDGAVGRMRSADFGRLAKAWQAAKPVDAGKQRASSD